ncbi:periplasmic heavy metal sensor [Verrucomicrobiales bacterium BCK34]|nr:periplasmic heavy metal sensor [Verrucomicrobiales bacterium BCK34]
MTRLRSILWSLGTVCLAAVVSYWVARGTLKRSEAPPAHEHSEQGFHAWLHENLAITPEQEAVLHPHEVAFEKDRNQIRAEIESSGRKLAAAIRAFDADSAEVTAAREELTKWQGELQEATLNHFFAMKEHLTEEQGAKLLGWTHDSIVHGHHD